MGLLMRVVLLVASLQASAGPATFFISPTGDDGAAGTTAEAPWRSLPHAQAQARQHKPPVTVSLLGGTYRVNSTLAFGKADSGVVWKNHDGAKPRVTGSIAVPWSAFTTVPASDARLPKAARGRARAAKLADIAPELGPGALGAGVAGWRFRDPDRLQVYVGGTPLTLARYPNVGADVEGSPFAGYATASAGYSAPEPAAQLQSAAGRCSCPPRFGLCPAACSAKANAISFSDAEGASGLPKDRPARWAATGGAPQLAVHGAFRYEWADQMLEVVSTNLSNSTFVFDQANCSALRYWPPQTGAPYYVVDVLQEMDAPGEFWLDRTSGELFIFPPRELENCAAADCPAIEISTPLPMPVIRASTSQTSCVLR